MPVLRIFVSSSWPRVTVWRSILLIEFRYTLKLSLKLSLLSNQKQLGMAVEPLERDILFYFFACVSFSMGTEATHCSM